MKILKQVLKIILVSLIFVILPIVAFTLVTSKTENLFGIKSFVVLTGSMEPTIDTGSIVFVGRDKSYQKGDIIAFESNNITVTHRVIEVQNGKGEIISPLVSPMLKQVERTNNVFYKTQGDANNSADTNLVSKEKVIGKAQFHFPYLGKAVLSLKSPQGFIIFIVLPMLIFVGAELWNIKKELEKSLERKWASRMRSNHNSSFWNTN